MGDFLLACVSQYTLPSIDTCTYMYINDEKGTAQSAVASRMM